MNLSTVKWAQWDKTQSRDLLVCSYVCALHCAQLLHTILHRTDLIISPLTLQTITTTLMMSIWGKGGKARWKYTITTTTTVLRPFFRDHPGEPVPEENFWTSCLQGKIKRGKHTDHPAGRHSIRTNQCPPPPSLHVRWNYRTQKIAICPPSYNFVRLYLRN